MENAPRLFSLGNHSKQLGRQGNLALTSPGHPLYLSFPDHVHGLNPWSVRHAVLKEKKPIPGCLIKRPILRIIFAASPCSATHLVYWPNCCLFLG